MKLIPSFKARLRWASLFLPAAAALHAGAAPATGSPPEDAALAAYAARPLEYSVINLGRDAGSAFLNQRGQAAFTSWVLDDGFHGFFDGRRVVPLHPVGGSFVYVNGLNDNGVVVGEYMTATNDYRAFSWTAARGVRVLPRNTTVSGPAGGSALAVNNRNQVVGSIRAQVGI